MSRRGRYQVYIVQCADGTYYTGSTNNLAQRLRRHASGRGAKYLRGRGPIRLVYAKAYGSSRSALRAEAQIKQQTRAYKAALIGAVRGNHKEGVMARRLVNAGSLAAGLGLLVLAASPALAKEGRKMDPAKYVEFLDKKLGLTDAQRGQVEQILTDYHGRVQSVKEQLEALRTEKREKIKAVLTPEQQEKFEKVHQRKGHGWRRWMRRGKDQG